MKASLRLLGSLAALSLLGLFAPVHAKDADAVLDRYVKAIGGDDAIRQITSREIVGQMTMPSAGMTINMTTLQKAPDFYLVEQNIPGMGRMLQGYDGTTAWTFNPMQGYRELEGAEKAQLLLGADIHADLNYKDKYPNRERLADQEIDGRPHHLVRLSGGDLPEVTLAFDASSHLLTRVTTDVSMGEMGNMPMQMELSDYRKADGLLTAHKVQTLAGPIEMTLTITKVNHNAQIDDRRFAPVKE